MHPYETLRLTVPIISVHPNYAGDLHSLEQDMVYFQALKAQMIQLLEQKVEDGPVSFESEVQLTKLMREILALHGKITNLVEMHNRSSWGDLKLDRRRNRKKTETNDQ